MKDNTFITCVLGLWIGSVLISLGLSAAIIYAAIHFISKYW